MNSRLPMPASNRLTIWTIGHSSHPFADFLALLAREEIKQVADVRRYPGSRAHPQYNAGNLAASLPEAGIQYLPFAELGGRRKPDPASHNTVWREPAFRAYADFMETREFGAALERVIAAARCSRSAIMCSEAVWWRCHRSLIADALKARDIEVLHIMSGKTTEHPYTSAARIVAGELRYGPA